jgi:hypothetical protein
VEKPIFFFVSPPFAAATVPEGPGAGVLEPVLLLGAVPELQPAAARLMRVRKERRLGMGNPSAGGGNLALAVSVSENRESGEFAGC